MSFFLIRDLKYYENLPYRVVVEEDSYTDGSKCFRAYHPELKGCSSHGETQEEAREDLKEATKLYLETLISQNQKIPLPVMPSTIGTIIDGISVNSTVFIPRALKPEHMSGQGKFQRWDVANTV